MNNFNVLTTPTFSDFVAEVDGDPVAAVTLLPDSADRTVEVNND